jgi:hypothetical protein
MSVDVGADRTIDLEHEDPRIEVPADPPADSPIARLRKSYRKLQEEHHVDLDIPGYQGQFVGRYVLIPKERAEEKARTYARMPEMERNEAAALDQIIEACDSLWMRDGDGNLEPLDAEQPDLKYDVRLADKLELGVKPARSIVKAIFTVGGVYNAAAMRAHAAAIGEWMQDVSREVDPAYLGE